MPQTQGERGTVLGGMVAPNPWPLSPGGERGGRGWRLFHPPFTIHQPLEERTLFLFLVPAAGGVAVVAVEELRAVAAELEGGLGGPVRVLGQGALEVLAALTVAGLLDLAFQFAQLALVVVRRHAGWTRIGIAGSRQAPAATLACRRNPGRLVTWRR